MEEGEDFLECYLSFIYYLMCFPILKSFLTLQFILFLLEFRFSLPCITPVIFMDVLLVMRGVHRSKTGPKTEFV